MAWNTIDNLKTFDDDFTPYAAELKEGQFLGENKNYRLEKNLGAGGMGEVWLASEIRGGVEIRKVVVKTLRADRRGNEGAQEKALKQFRLIQSLNHTNICPIYVIEHDPACGYLIVMGYADGGSYADWFAEKPKSLTEACDVLRPIADALDFAHGKEVIHRDVKPENMMFTSDGTPWLIDFGIAARLRSESKATTSQFSQSGTASYMAPEQKTGQLQTAQTDEYSLAMVVLEFLTGSLSPLSLFMLSPDLQPIVAKALSPDPSARYPTCRAFIDALVSTGTSSAPPTPPSIPAVQVAKKPSLKAGDRKIWTASGIDYAFRWCPPGEFMMGGPRREWNGSKWIQKSDQHRVKLTRGFWLLETQVTQVMWKSVMGTNPSRFKGWFGISGASRPVEYVSWDDCQEFCRKLSQKLGQQVQLPTEAQWEYACRAGTTGDYAGTLAEMAWYYDNSGSATNAVGQKQPNAWSLYDMHGNVWEWCSDYYAEDYYSRSPTSDPENTEASSIRVVRGGGWSDDAEYCRSACRGRNEPGDRVNDLDLRVLLVPSQE